MTAQEIVSAVSPDVLRFPAGHPITATEYDSLSEDCCRDIEIVDGMVVVSPSHGPDHQDTATTLWAALSKVCRPRWRASCDVDLRLRDDPLENRRPDVVVYRRDAVFPPVRAADAILVIEVVSPGSTTTDRKIDPIVYAEAGITHYWRVELKPDMPVVHTYVLDEATTRYVAGPFFVGKVEAIALFRVTVDLTDL